MILDRERGRYLKHPKSPTNEVHCSWGVSPTLHPKAGRSPWDVGQSHREQGEWAQSSRE